MKENVEHTALKRMCFFYIYFNARHARSSSISSIMLFMLAYRASRASCSNVKPFEHSALSDCSEPSVLYSSTHSVNFVPSDRLVTYERALEKKSFYIIVKRRHYNHENRHENTTSMKLDTIQKRLTKSKKQKNNKFRDKSQITCYNCNKKKHYKKKCRNKQINVTATTKDEKFKTLNAIFEESSLNYAKLHWIECCDDDCIIHRSDKNTRYHSRFRAQRKKERKVNIEYAKELNMLNAHEDSQLMYQKNKNETLIFSSFRHDNIFTALENSCSDSKDYDDYLFTKDILSWKEKRDRDRKIAKQTLAKEFSKIENRRNSNFSYRYYKH